MSDLMTLSEYDLNQQIMQMKQRIAEVNDFFSQLNFLFTSSLPNQTW